NKWKINAVKIGQVIEEKLMRVKENGVVVCEIPPELLTEKAPLYDRETKEPAYLQQAQDLNRESVPEPDDLNQVLLELLDSPTIASKESAYQKFSSFGNGVTVGAGSDAAVIKLKETNKALAISVDCNSRFCYLNPHQGAMMAVAEAARNVVCSGGRPLAITDGLNFGNPMKPENYWQFTKCIEGLADACKALDTPVISGNVSFYNENPKGAVDPTPMVGMVGVIQDADKYVTQNFKNAGDVIVLLGENKADLSGSEYLYRVHKQKKGNPQIDINKEKGVQQVTLEAIESGIINSAHDCSEGGLACALAESCISRDKQMLGAKIKLDQAKNEGIRSDELLYGEAPSRIVVSLSKDNLKALEKIAEKHSLSYQVLGDVGGENLTIEYKRKQVVDLPLSKLSDTWRKAIPSRLGE
ncbi:MAG: phosphoribosylformylglycinamidine synthase II, partial [Candidatus Omnitrophica bacterium]|nr:phosphoribosylformylglycinamidine synthase II [Candidatus Omnitrophota bacterium]